MQEAVVFGAGGQMGRAVALALVAAGWRVRAVTRGGRPLPAGLHGAIAVDGTGQSRAQVIGAGADAVFDPLCMDAAGAGALLAARGAVGRFVVISTAAVYADAQGRCLEQAGDTGFPQFDTPITESQATVAPGAGYGPAKVAMEQALLDSGAPVAVLRPGAIHGILARHPREWVFVKRVLDGRQAVPVVHAQGRFGTTAAAAVGSLTQAVLQAGAGGVFNVADADAPPVSAIAQAIAGLMGRPLQVVPIPPQEGAEDHVGHTPWSVPGPMVLDCARAAALGWTAPPYAQSVAPLVDWLAGHAGADWRAAFPGFGHYGFDPFDYATEDRVLARLG